MARCPPRRQRPSNGILLADVGINIPSYGLIVARRTLETREDALRRFVDLPDALAAAVEDATAREWRVHFHVPLFREELGPLRSTQPWVAALLRQLVARAYDGHLEVETYTWDVLPDAYRGEPVAAAVARELAWTMEQLTT